MKNSHFFQEKNVVACELNGEILVEFTKKNKKVRIFLIRKVCVNILKNYI